MLINKNMTAGFPFAAAGEATMKEHGTEQGFDRRDFLKTAFVGGAAAAGGTAGITAPEIAQAQQPAAPAAAAGYAFLNLDEAAFVEALVDHMIPADRSARKAPILAST